MLVAMVGFLSACYIIYPMSSTWGFTFAFTFLVLLSASIYNFTHAPDEDDLAVHEPHRHLKRLAVYKK